MQDNREQLSPNTMAGRFRGFLPVVIDLETGGFNCATDALLEVAAVTLEMDEDGTMRPAATLSANIVPFEGANIEKSALEFTGIDPFDPQREARMEEDALKSVLRPIRQAVRDNWCTRAIMVAHNAHFDLGFFNAAIVRTQIKRNPFHPFSCFDTATLAGLAYGQTVLSRACQEARISFDNHHAHSAVYDAEKTAELFCAIVNRWLELGGWKIDRS